LNIREMLERIESDTLVPHAAKSAETRGRLLQATIDLLVERGYPRLTVADIARRAGVSNGARVHHFPTKEDLVVAANEQLYGDAVARSGRLGAAGGEGGG
jgi:AcrR family transcriptional regulator